MNEINETTIIASLLVQIDKDSISVDELLQYSEEIYNKLKDNKYCVRKVEKNDILKFFKYYVFIGKIENNIIYLDQSSNYKQKIQRFLLKDINQDLIVLLKKSQKFIFPIINNNELIKYYLKIDNFEFIDSFKDQFLYDQESNRYILDLNIIIEKFGSDYLDEFFNNMTGNYTIEKKETLAYNTFLEFFDDFDYLDSLKFKKIVETLNISSELLNIKKSIDNLLNYYSAAQNNQVILSNNVKYKTIK